MSKISLNSTIEQEKDTDTKGNSSMNPDEYSNNDVGIDDKSSRNKQESGCFNANCVNSYVDNLECSENGFTSSKNLQNSAILSNENFQTSNITNTESDPVSEFGVRNDTENSLQNSIFELTNDEIVSFASVFPGVSIENIKKDPNFLIFAKGKTKSSDFSSLYADYLTLVKKIGKELEIRGKIAQNNKSSSPGSLSCSSAENINYFTREQVLKMSKAQIAKNFKIIRESQQKW